MARRLTAGRVAGVLACTLFGGCEAGDAGRDLPPFAAALPGHTAIVAWGASDAVESLVAALPLARVGLTPAKGTPDGVRAWLAAPQGVGWPSLAGNRGFATAAGEFAPGGAHLFVDLQQTIDTARAALAADLGGEVPAGVRGFVEQRVWRILRLDALEWLLLRRPVPAEATLEAVVASGDATRGLFAALAETALSAPTDEVPTPAAYVLRATIVPGVVVAGIRELLADTSEGPLAALQQLVQGSGLHAAIDALDSLDGTIVAAAGPGFGWARCGVRDANVVEAALDAFAVSRGGHWLVFGNVRVELDDAVLRVSYGEVPAGRRRLAPSPAALHVEGVTPPFEVTAARTGTRLRARGRLP